MRKILTLLLLLPFIAQGQNNQKGGDANQNIFFNGMVSVERVFVEPINDTGVVNMYFLPPFWNGRRKEGAHGWGGLTKYIYRSGEWRAQVGSGSGADGNNFVTAVSFNPATGQLVVSRQGMSSVSTSIEGRYAYTNHGHTIDSVAGLRDSLRQLGQSVSAIVWPIPGTPSTFNPLPHTHDTGSIVGLVQALLGTRTFANTRAAAAHQHGLGDLTQSGATNGQVPQWNGSAWVPATVSGGGGGSVNSVGLTMPSAFSVAGSPVTSNGVLAVSMPGTTAQYLRGNGTVATFPTAVSTFTNDANYTTLPAATAAAPVQSVNGLTGNPVIDTGNLASFTPGLNVLRAANEQRVKYSDTSGMLAAYASGIAARLRIADTAAMLTPYARSSDYYTRSASDSRYYLASNPSSYATTLDVSTASTNDRIRANHTGTQDTSTMPGYTLGLNVLRAAIEQRLKYSDTALMLSGIYSVLNGKMRYADTATMLTNYARSADFYNRAASDARYYSLTNPNNYTSNLGTVTSVSIASANGVSGTVTNPSTTPQITLTLGAISPTSVNVSGTITASNFSGVSTGTNTGDQANITGNAGTVSTISGLVTAGTNMTRTGSGTLADPYILSSTASGGGGSTDIHSILGRNYSVYGVANNNASSAFTVTTTGLIGNLSHNGSTTTVTAGINKVYGTYLARFNNILSTSAAATNSNSGWAGPAALGTTVGGMSRGVTQYDGGIDAIFRFAVPNLAAGNRVIIGLTSTQAGGPTTEPSNASYTDLVGLIKDAADATLYFTTRTAGGTINKVSLGMLFNPTSIYELRITCVAGSSTMTVKLTEFADGVAPNVVATNTFTTGLPATGAYLTPYLIVNTGTSASATSVRGYRMEFYADPLIN